MDSDSPALRLRHHFFSHGERVFCMSSLRTRALVFRHVHHERLIVDERLLCSAFPYVTAAAQRCVLMLGGQLELHEHPKLTARAGDCVLFGRAGRAGCRWTSAEFLEFEWEAPLRVLRARATRLGKVELAKARRFARAIDDRGEDAGRALTLGWKLFRSVGAPVGPAPPSSGPRPTAEERRLISALEEQVNDLRGRATVNDLVAVTKRSPRQLQRVVRRFNERYGVDAGNWRDLRNRCRLQLAAMMLSLPELSIATIAREVGYSSPNALTRAFARTGLSSPARFRQRLLEGVADKDH